MGDEVVRDQVQNMQLVKQLAAQELYEIVNDHFGSGDAQTHSINDEAEPPEQVDDVDEEERDDPPDREKNEINGGWSSWSSWSSCTKSCNTGQRHRDRTCSDPAPVGSGRVCIGQTDELSNCNESPCPVDGQWTDWLQWSGCSVSCGSGQMTRQRLCLNPKPSNGGQSCVGPSSKQSTCETANCPVNGGWSSWSSWSTCTKSCNTGQKHRNRTCSNPAPVWSGRACIGQTDELSNCNESPCPGIKSAFTFSNPAAGPTNGTIKFTRVVTNIGGHYNTATGKFTCQYPGIYVFLLHILKNTGANSAFCYIKMNDSNKMFVQSYTGISNAAGNYGASNSVILHLGSGDIVDLDGCSSVDTFWTSWQTSFSGFLLKED